MLRCSTKTENRKLKIEDFFVFPILDVILAAVVCSLCEH